MFFIMLYANYIYEAPDGRMFSAIDILGKFDVFAYKTSHYVFIPILGGEKPCKSTFVYDRDKKQLYQSGVNIDADVDPKVNELFSVSDTDSIEGLYKTLRGNIFEEYKDDICKKLVKLIEL